LSSEVGEERGTDEVVIGTWNVLWSDNFENDLNTEGVRGCRKIARDRDAWKLILKKGR
jgi:hypothetical protein